jgi:type II secretory pathway predicted ATPase ExeA
MYCDFYGLSERPFELTPDPMFFYESPGHREALASLIRAYAVNSTTY